MFFIFLATVAFSLVSYDFIGGAYGKPMIYGPSGHIALSIAGVVYLFFWAMSRKTE